MLAHEEIIQELGIDKKELPSTLSYKSRNLINRSRFAKKQDVLDLINRESEHLANDIAEWYSSNFDEEEEEEGMSVEPEFENEEDNEEKEAVIKKEEPKNVNSHIVNNEVKVEEPKKEEDEDDSNGWGINLGW